MNQNRTPAGIPTGGQFAASVRAESSVALDDADSTNPSASLVARCPDCGAPMFGHIGNGKFLPGAECEECGHEASVMEVESDGQYDEDGQSHLYRLDHDGQIRVIDADGNTVMRADCDEEDWDGLNPFDIDRSAVAQALEARDDPYDFYLDQCDQVGLPVMAEAYIILHDRETVPHGFLVSNLTGQDVEAHYEQYIGPALDSLAADFSGGYNETPLSQEAQHNVEEACNAAGLASMNSIYQALADRECLSDARALALTAHEVSQNYEQHVAPAIDRLELRFQKEYSYSRAQAQFDDMDAAIDRLEEFDENADVRPFDKALEAGWDAFDQADGGPDALRAYAASLEEAGRSATWIVANRAGYNTDLGPEEYGADRIATRDAGWERRIEEVQGRLTRIAERLRKAATALDGRDA